MASPPIDKERAEKMILRTEYWLREGYAPPGIASAKPGMKGAIRMAAEECGVTQIGSVAGFLRASIRAVGREPDWTLYGKPKEADIRFPELSDPEMPLDELLEAVDKQWHRRNKAVEDRKWMEIGVGDKPILIGFMGDPHVDDNGCNWPLLRRDVELLKNTPRAYAVNLGDWTNNWSGRLAEQISPYQEVTRPQAWRLAEWLMESVPWLLLLKGNHDAWSVKYGQGDPLDFMRRGITDAPMEDWSAQVQFTFDNGESVPAWITHHFKGSSIYNPLHGAMRAARFSGRAAIYASGHTHEWAIHQEEDPERQMTWTAIKARGYKYIDPHAVHLQFPPQQCGATIAMVIDPSTSPPTIYPFRDLETGCRFVQYLND